MPLSKAVAIKVEVIKLHAIYNKRYNFSFSVMKQKHVLNCQLSSWYPSFKNVTFSSKIIPLETEFIDYLNEDGIVLPGCHTNSNSEDSDSDNWCEDEDNLDTTSLAPTFDELTRKIEEAIKSLGGTVFPKLNWSAPRDAAWISYNGTLKCTTPSDVYLLLKSSDRVSHDVNHAFQNCEDRQDNMLPENSNFTLVLRKWYEVPSSTEFRCFVKKRCVIGISQRDTACHYPYIAENYRDIIPQIKDFFKKRIKNRFPDLNYVFDIFLQSNGNVMLVDFNPFGAVTDPLLFTWDELSNMQPDNDGEEEEDIMFRFVKSGTGVQPSPFLASRVPKENFDLTTSDDINKMVDFLNTQDIIDTNQ